MYKMRKATKEIFLQIGLYLSWPVAFVCSFIGFMFLMIEAIFIALFRGPRYVRWIRLSECADFNSWLSAEWQYYGRGGMQWGVRRFGLEVARKGYIGNNHPLI